MKPVRTKKTAVHCNDYYIRDANMFHNRVINLWNKLPDSVVLAASISNFKRLLLSFVVNVGFEHFSVN